jgi:hypothetical protein
MNLVLRESICGVAIVYGALQGQQGIAADRDGVTKRVTEWRLEAVGLA